MWSPSDLAACDAALRQDLIVRLMEEANQETEHKGWCDTELATNKVGRRDRGG